MPLDELRDWVAGTIRAGVVGSGDDVAERQRALFDAPGERWFDEGSPIRSASMSMPFARTRAMRSPVRGEPSD